MESDSDIEVGNLIPGVGVDEAVVDEAVVIHQHIADELEVTQNQKLKDLASHISRSQPLKLLLKFFLHDFDCFDAHSNPADS